MMDFDQNLSRFSEVNRDGQLSQFCVFAHAWFRLKRKKKKKIKLSQHAIFQLAPERLCVEPVNISSCRKFCVSVSHSKYMSTAARADVSCFMAPARLANTPAQRLHSFQHAPPLSADRMEGWIGAGSLGEASPDSSHVPQDAPSRPLRGCKPRVDAQPTRVPASGASHTVVAARQRKRRFSSHAEHVCVSSEGAESRTRFS